MALPRVLSLSADGELEMTIAPEAQSLREKAYSLPPKNSAKDSEVLQFILIKDLRAELAWKISAQNFAFSLEDHSGPWWSASLAQNDSVTTVTANGATVEISGAANSAHDFRLFLDAPVVELIVDRRHAITSRIYRQPDGPLHIKIGNDTRLASFEGWPLRPYLLRSPYNLTSAPAFGKLPITLSSVKISKHFMPIPRLSVLR